MWYIHKNILFLFILSFALGSLLEIEDSKSINKEEADPTNGVDMSPSGTLTRGCKMDRDDQINVESDAGMQPPRPTRYTIEIDDCLPEYCVDCPLWKPFSPRHFCWLKFRCRVRFLVEKKYFEWFILATVFFSSFTLVCSSSALYLNQVIIIIIFLITMSG